MLEWALNELCPGASWSIIDGAVMWHDLNSTKPSDLDINEKILEYEKSKIDRISEIHKALEQIDMKAVRPLRAITTGNGSNEDLEELERLESEAQVLRQELSSLT